MKTEERIKFLCDKSNIHSTPFAFQDHSRERQEAKSQHSWTGTGLVHIFSNHFQKERCRLKDNELDLTIELKNVGRGNKKIHSSSVYTSLGSCEPIQCFDLPSLSIQESKSSRLFLLSESRRKNAMKGSDIGNAMDTESLNDQKSNQDLFPIMNLEVQNDSLLDKTPDTFSRLNREVFHEENMTSSLDNLSSRVCWLVMLLLIQSFVSFVLQRFQGLVNHHPIVLFSLTMLVGSGGNAGSQSAVLVIRSLALGTCTPKNFKRVIFDQFYVGTFLAIILTCFTFARLYLFRENLSEIIAVCTSMFVIVIVSVLIGTTCPLLFSIMKIDPAHAGAAVQVIMDLVGVCLTCIVSYAILDYISMV